MTISRQRVGLAYALSLPERSVRAAAAWLGGTLFEITRLMLPGWFRSSRLYRAVAGATLRIVVELVGGATGILPPDGIPVRDLAVRKAAGSGIELAGLAVIGWSPLWLFAAAADLIGGSRAYLRALVSELQRDRVLPEDADVASVERLLEALEGTSGLMADTLDVPPLNTRDMRASWQILRQHVTELPDAARLASLFADLQRVATKEGRSLLAVSSLIAIDAARAGIRAGHTHIFDFYQDALRTIAGAGLPAYARQVSRPYLAVARAHLDPTRTSHTERLLQRIHQRAVPPADGSATQ